MRPANVFNFVSLIDQLTNHDWEAEPYVLLAGPNSSGKSTIHAQVLRSLKGRGLTLGIDAREALVEAQLVSRALTCASHDEFTATRTLQHSTSAQTVFAGSSFNHTNVTIKNSSWLRRSPRPNPDEENGRAKTQVSVLITDIIAVHREVFLVVDHYDEAEPFLRQFVGDLAQRVGPPGRLRLMLICNTADTTYRPLGGMNPAQYVVPRLDWEAIQRWAEELDLPVGEDNARMLYSLSDRGCAGTVRTQLMKLVTDASWQYAPDSLRTQ